MEVEKMEQHFRQGDLVFIPVAAIPEKAKKGKDRVLALGEATGHHHSAISGTKFEVPGGLIANTILGASGTPLDLDPSVRAEKFLRVPKRGTTVTHQEHGPIQLPAGNWMVVIEREYTPVAVRNVLD